jgi:hypothetical protein
MSEARLPFERRAFTVVAAVTLVRHEDDDDLHLVLRAGGGHLIAEAPLPACGGRAASRYRRAMAVARSHVRLCARARVTGVAFFDFDRGLTGIASNAIELHPILCFHCLNALTLAANRLEDAYAPLLLGREIVPPTKKSARRRSHCTRSKLPEGLRATPQDRSTPTTRRG